MKPEPKNLHILLITEHQNASESVISNGLIMAEIFNANIIWVQVCFKNENHLPEPHTTEQNGIKITPLYISHKNLHTVFDIAENNNAIMTIMAVDKAKPNLNAPRKVLKLARKSRIPFLLVQNKTPYPSQFKNIVLPVDFLQQTKEKALWASYFHRFNESIIHAITTPYKDEYYRMHSKNNLKFIQRMYHNLDVEYQTLEIAGANLKLDQAAIDYAAKIDAALVVIMTTLDYNIDDMIMGPPELKLIQNQHQIPVLCLNQRNDIYVLCS
ncbi:MAG: hypothetical protein WCH34_07260 [Bacteroidota bacterium]